MDALMYNGGKIREYCRIRLLLRREMMANQENFSSDIRCIAPQGPYYCFLIHAAKVVDEIRHGPHPLNRPGHAPSQCQTLFLPRFARRLLTCNLGDAEVGAMTGLQDILTIANTHRTTIDRVTAHGG